VADAVPSGVLVAKRPPSVDAVSRAEGSVRGQVRSVPVAVVPAGVVLAEDSRVEHGLADVPFDEAGG
jgi:hypothetical protein